MWCVSPAREWGQETGLYYYRARYYDPNIGRFLSEDPVRLTGGINFYTYVFNSPPNAIDPMGLDCRTWLFWVTCNDQGQPSSIIAAERAHEKQHVRDNRDLVSGIGLLGYVIAIHAPGTCELLERRGFAQEIPILQKRRDELKSKNCLTDEEKKELQLVEDELNNAIDMQTKPGNAKVYCQSGGR